MRPAMQPARRLFFFSSSSSLSLSAGSRCSLSAATRIRTPRRLPSRSILAPPRTTLSRPLHTSTHRPFAASQAVAMSDDGKPAEQTPVATTNGPSELDQTLLSRLRDTPFRQPESLDSSSSSGMISSWGKDIYSGLNPVKASLYPYPAATYTFYVEPRYANLSGNLHGGAAATIFDIATTMTLALVQKPEFWEYWGVTRTLNCSYLRPVQTNKYVTIHCEIIGIGKRLAHIRGQMKDKEGRILITCEHDKVNIDGKVFAKL